MCIRDSFCTLPRQKPTIAMAKQQPRELYELSNEALAIAARSPEAHDVHQERLIRDIMATDEVEYDKAAARMEEVFLYNQTRRTILLPYEVGLAGTMLCAILCFPVVFHDGTATAFADFIGATEECPPGTFADVGTWSWAWMEPMMGTASFSLLCLQQLRLQMSRLAFKPYYDYVQSRRANQLAAHYPRYNRTIIKEFGRSQPLRGDKFNPVGSKSVSYTHLTLPTKRIV
eukprot:TRINITY_DN5978_c0_g1_i2.p1 TRINITY_DN5978_c0_g1~~TRINITY_DN5978_c0_g1_i2.p1  ORF type:complete len:230 (-),score=52.75 TRINITY_DN5978_c0_g1_i2:88-777(-)